MPAAVSEASPAAPEEATLLKGSGVTIGWSGSSSREWWTAPVWSGAPAPPPGGATSFPAKLLEVKGLPSSAPVAEAAPAEVPTATPVPGKPGFVELSFDPRGLPYIDIRGLAPGLEVQIVDPLDPGKAIRFRIPEGGEAGG